MATARASERKVDLLNMKNHQNKNVDPLKEESSEEETVHFSPSDLLAPVRFNILGQMQIPSVAGRNNHHPNSANNINSHSINSHNNNSHHSSPLHPSAFANQINAVFSLHHQPQTGPRAHTNNTSHNSKSSDKNNNNNNNNNNKSKHSEAESPLDFSTKKPKLEEKAPESPSSKLRNILSMKSPSISEEIINSNNNHNGIALNLSKESPSSGSSVWSKDSRGSLTSSPLSPSMESPQALIQIPSPRPATIPVSLNAPGHNGNGVFSNGGGGHYPMSFSPWGNGVFSPSLSPVLNQSGVPTGVGFPLGMDAALFPQIAIGTASTSPNFSHGAQVNGNGNGNGASNKARPATRPFKAYPKDPMTFSSVGLYGLPMGPAPGGTEAIMHQQSNQAYAEFRKQMLASSQMGRSRRVGHKSGQGESDSSNEHEGLGFRMSLENEVGMADSHSSPEGDLHNGKIRAGKTEQQMKDEAYWERRRKNNEAAKRSRDARRAKEDEIAIRAAFLEQENLKLRFELSTLKNETAKLRCMLYSST